jgi:hypothetical protein
MMRVPGNSQLVISEISFPLGTLFGMREAGVERDSTRLEVPTVVAEVLEGVITAPDLAYVSERLHQMCRDYAGRVRRARARLFGPGRSGVFAFGLVLLPTLAFVGLVTFERTLQSGIEDLGYARRIARLRAYYFDKVPELAPYLLSARPDQRLFGEGLSRGYYAQGFRTVAGMVGVITAVLAGSEVGLAVATAFDAPAAALASGAVFGLVVLLTLMRYQLHKWARAMGAPIGEDTAQT